MNLFRIKQQLPLVLSVMRQYEDGALKVKHVRFILQAIENFHFAFTAIASQRSSGGISFMYALAARELHQAKNLEAKAAVLQSFHKNKLKDKRPPYPEFEPHFLELAYSTKQTKQKNLVRYILTKIYQQNSIGLTIDPDQMTIEHLASEKPKGPEPADKDVASVGNLLLVNQKLNDKLANQSVLDKIKILKNANVWIDPVILSASDWNEATIKARAEALAQEAYNKVWPL